MAGPAGAEAGRDEPGWGGEAEADMNGHYVGPAMRENKARCKGGGFMSAIGPLCASGGTLY